MYRILRYFIAFVCMRVTSADTYSVKISLEQHVNVIDSKFLSFTIDPKYLFSSNDKYHSKECICMASSLTPAYIRIAGPSTSHMTFHNTTISIEDLEIDDTKDDLNNEYSNEITTKSFEIRNHFKVRRPKRHGQLSVGTGHWKKFVQWAKSTGFDLVYALNNDEKTASGIWDPNTALNILTVADKTNVSEIFWQLGYECSNQSIEEYLNDLETLRVIVETFPSELAKGWRVVGGDVTPCLHADSKNDFKDFVTLSVEMMDAVLLNGNSTSNELDRMSDSERYKLLKLLSASTAPLWLTESIQKQYNELERAADWMASLGYSARNGFSVHFRELLEEEMYQPTLSFYMALLFKNLVGERVLNVDMKGDRAIMFAHCTSLHHKPVPGAVTLYGANMDDESARFSIKLSNREEGGDIMQFILGHDHSGNIIVNGRAMYYEGDIRPVVKRVRPYKTLFINLPPKSFGFWVLANTKIDACYYNDNGEKLVEAASIPDKEVLKVRKRSIIDKQDFQDYPDFTDNSKEIFFKPSKNMILAENEAFKRRIDNLNRDLRKLHALLKTRSKVSVDWKSNHNLKRTKRQIDEEIESPIEKLRKSLKLRSDKKRFPVEDFKPKLAEKLMQLNSKLNVTRNRSERKIKKPRYTSNKSKRKPNRPRNPMEKLNNEKIVTRARRSASKEKYELSDETEETSSENEVDAEDKQDIKLGKILRRIQKQLNVLPILEKNEDIDVEESSKGLEDHIVVKTKISDDNAVINVSEKSHHGLLKSTFKNLYTVLDDLNKNLNRFWNAVTFF